MLQVYSKNLRLILDNLANFFKYRRLLLYVGIVLLQITNFF